MPEEDAKVEAAATNADQESQNKGKQPAGQTPPTNVANPDGSDVKLEDLPDYWKNHIKSLRTENRDFRTKDEQAAKDKEDAERKDLEQRQAWEEIANKTQQEVERLKPLAADAEKLGALISSQIDEEVAKWPKEVSGTQPEGELSALARYEWFVRMKPLAQRLMQVDTQSTQTRVGNRSGPPPLNTVATGGKEAERKQAGEPLVSIDRRF